MSSTIYLVRHATPDWNRNDIRYDIPPGPPLTAHGAAEAAKLATFLQQAGVSNLLASPLERAMRTAQIVADFIFVPVTIVDEIAEWRTGEPEPDVLARMIRTLDGVAADGAGSGSTVLVSHGGPIRLFLQHIGVDPDVISFYRKQFDRDNPLPPAGAWRLTCPVDDVGWSAQLEFTPDPHRPYVVQPVLV